MRNDTDKKGTNRHGNRNKRAMKLPEMPQTTSQLQPLQKKKYPLGTDSCSEAYAQFLTAVTDFQLR
jgi:hypothetical protein